MFAAVPDCKTDVWTRIAEVALKLDKQDFLDSSLADYEKFNLATIWDDSLEEKNLESSLLLGKG